jgi:hypothetical protein
MSRIRFIAFLILIGHNLSVLAQHKEKEVFLNSLEIQNSQLTTVLDSIVDNEKKCDYYSCKLTFAINVKNSTFYPSFIVESISDRNLVLGLNPYGYFYRKGHLFIVDGDMLNDLFSQHEKGKKFKYVEYDTSFEEYDSRGNRILRITNDDSFSQWEYQLASGHIEFVEGYSSCDSEDKMPR